VIASVTKMINAAARLFISRHHEVSSYLVGAPCGVGLEWPFGSILVPPRGGLGCTIRPSAVTHTVIPRPLATSRAFRSISCLAVSMLSAIRSTEIEDSPKES
jgi:hypothetical protein